MLPAVLPVPIPADTLVIVVVPMNVQEGLKIIPVLMQQQPNAAQLVVIAKTVLPEVPLTPALMPDLRNAVPVITVQIPAVPERKAAFHVPVIIFRPAFLLPSAVPVVMNANIILIVL